MRNFSFPRVDFRYIIGMLIIERRHDMQAISWRYEFSILKDGVNIMKRIISVLLAASMLLTLAACGIKETPETTAVPEESVVITESAAESTINTSETVQTEAETIPAPTITKSPTSESITEGEQALFVAHADGADGIQWWFQSSGDIKEIDSNTVLTTFPELRIDGALDDTLILSDIPLEMNGWFVKAEFFNSAGSSFTESAEIQVAEKVGLTQEEELEIYEPVLENCRYIEHFKPNTHTPEERAEKDIFNMAQCADLVMEDLGYALMDLDDDGIDELLIGCPTENEFGSMGGEIIIALFTIEDGQPVNVFHSWARNRHYLCRDNLIFNHGSNGAANWQDDLFSFEDGELILQIHLKVDDTDQETREIRFYCVKDGTTDLSEENRITSEEFTQSCEELENMVISLPPLTPVSDSE